MEAHFQGLVDRYRVLTTADSGPTLYAEGLGEACHNMAGSISETRYNFIEGCEILSKVRIRRNLNIFETGLGTALGYLLTLEALGAGYGGKLTFISTEIDPVLIRWSQRSLPVAGALGGTFPTLGELKWETSGGTLDFAWAEKNGHKLIILLGDARKSLPAAVGLGLIPPLDAIYQDPFSPRKNPTLWAEAWFGLLAKLSHPQVILSTYSASSSARKALRAAGFVVERRKGFAGKRESTRAFLLKRDSPPV